VGPPAAVQLDDDVGLAHGLNVGLRQEPPDAIGSPHTRSCERVVLDDEDDGASSAVGAEPDTTGQLEEECQASRVAIGRPQSETEGREKIVLDKRRADDRCCLGEARDSSVEIRMQAVRNAVEPFPPGTTQALH